MLTLTHSSYLGTWIAVYVVVEMVKNARGEWQALYGGACLCPRPNRSFVTRARSSHGRVCGAFLVGSFDTPSWNEREQLAGKLDRQCSAHILARCYRLLQEQTPRRSCRRPCNRPGR